MPTLCYVVFLGKARRSEGFFGHEAPEPNVSPMPLELSIDVSPLINGSSARQIQKEHRRYDLIVDGDPSQHISFKLGGLLGTLLISDTLSMKARIR